MREDMWMEIEIGEFFTDQVHGMVEMCLMEIENGNFLALWSMALSFGQNKKGKRNGFAIYGLVFLFCLGRVVYTR
jgi:hypothetical protein